LSDRSARPTYFRTRADVGSETRSARGQLACREPFGRISGLSRSVAISGGQARGVSRRVAQRLACRIGQPEPRSGGGAEAECAADAYWRPEGLHE
jgi:hypothetical protein